MLKPGRGEGVLSLCASHPSLTVCVGPLNARVKCKEPCKTLYSCLCFMSSALTFLLSSRVCFVFVLQFDGKPYAALRAHTWFYNVTSSVWRDTLFDASRRQMCKGGFNNGIWYMVNDLVVSNGLTVSQNSESDDGTWLTTPLLSECCYLWSFPTVYVCKTTANITTLPVACVHVQQQDLELV